MQAYFYSVVKRENLYLKTGDPARAGQVPPLYFIYLLTFNIINSQHIDGITLYKHALQILYFSPCNYTGMPQAKIDSSEMMHFCAAEALKKGV